MNQERPNEAVARRIVERVMGMGREHADTHGGVDYVSPDRTVALEVTAVTEGKKKGELARPFRGPSQLAQNGIAGVLAGLRGRHTAKDEDLHITSATSHCRAGIPGETSFDEQRDIVRILGGDARSRI